MTIVQQIKTWDNRAQRYEIFPKKCTLSRIAEIADAEPSNHKPIAIPGTEEEVDQATIDGNGFHDAEIAYK